MSTKINFLGKIILIAIFIFGFVMRFYGIFELKKNFSYDESVSYLSATGNEGKYFALIADSARLINSVVKAQEWKQVYSVNSPLCFRTIALDLAHHQDHPPFYFWLLHICVLIFGVQFYTGLILNLSVTVLSLFILYKLSELILKDRFYSLLVCLFWFLSPAVVQIDFEARPFGLFGLFSILLYYETVIIIRDNKLILRNFIFLLIISFLGFITHYYFGFVLLGTLLLLFWRFGFCGIIWKASLASVVGFLLFVLSFPFVDFVMHFSFKNASLAHQSFVDKIKTQVYAALDYGAYGHLKKYFFLGILLIFFVTALLKVSREKLNFRKIIEHHSFNVMFLLIWNASFTFVLYMFSIAPPQAAGEQYYSYIWPLFSIVIVLAIRYVRMHLLITVTYLFILTINYFFAVVRSPYLQTEIPVSWYDEANNSDLIILNTCIRGYLPRTLYPINSNKEVFVGEYVLPKDLSKYNRIVFFDFSGIAGQQNNFSPVNLPGYKIIKRESSPDIFNSLCYFSVYSK